jgi:regulatory protein
MLMPVEAHQPHQPGEPEADPVEIARRIVLQQLSRSPRTRAQLQEACRRRGGPDTSTETVLDRFAELGLVDDDAFARAWVESRHAGRGLARRALTHELRTRGVPEDTVEAAVERVDEQAERTSAEALVRARLPGLQRHDRTTQMRRLHGLLVRRGYPPGMALAVVRSVLGEADPV